MRDVLDDLKDLESTMGYLGQVESTARRAIAEIQRLRGVVAPVEREVATLDKHGPGPHSCCHAYGDDIAEDIRSVMQAAPTKPGAGGEG